MDWAGASSDGAPLPSGSYRLTLESYQGSRLLQSDPVPVYTTVREVIAAADGSVTVVSDRGDRFSAASVLALRHPR
jgi:flagellar basal-body rod modification protein FlgD